jgi:hypothetical protein
MPGDPSARGVADRAAAKAAVDDGANTAVSRRMAALEERRRTGVGRFILRDEIDRHPGSPLNDLLRPIPGLRFIPLPQPCVGMAVASSRPGVGLPAVHCQGEQVRPACYLAIFVDGVPYWRLGEHDLVSLDQFEVRTLEAIEVYVGEARAPGFSGMGTECGVLALWTRD